MCVGADADKRKNWDYYEAMLKLVRPGGLILIDNVLFYGRVADSEVRRDTKFNSPPVIQVQWLSFHACVTPVSRRGCQDDDKKIVAIRELNQKLLMDDRITLSIVPVGDGIAICRRR